MPKLSPIIYNPKCDWKELGNLEDGNYIDEGRVSKTLDSTGFTQQRLHLSTETQGKNIVPYKSIVFVNFLYVQSHHILEGSLEGSSHFGRVNVGHVSLNWY